VVNPIIYVTRGELSDEFELKRREWYKTRHSTDVVGVGFWSARGYRCPTKPRNFNIYELPSAELLATDAYMNMRKADTFSPTVMKAFEYISAALYTQLCVKDAQGRVVENVPSIRGPVLVMLNFDSDESEETIQSWFEDEIANSHHGTEDIRTFRLWEQRAAHPLFPPKEPRWCATIEWARDPGDAKQRLYDAAKSGKVKLTNVRPDIATKWYGLVREDIFETAN